MVKHPGKYLKEMCKERKLSVRKCSRLMGLSDVYAWDLTVGRRSFTPAIAKKIEKAFPGEIARNWILRQERYDWYIGRVKDKRPIRVHHAYSADCGRYTTQSDDWFNVSCGACLTWGLRAALNCFMKHRTMTYKRGGWWAPEFAIRARRWPHRPIRRDLGFTKVTIDGLILRDMVIVVREDYRDMSKHRKPIAVAIHPDYDVPGHDWKANWKPQPKEWRKAISSTYGREGDPTAWGNE